MAIIKPFRGIRFNQEMCKNPGLNISPPFDAITPKLNEALHRRSKHNIVRLEIARRNRSDESFHQVASTQSEWLKSEILVKDKKPALYVTEEEFNYRGENFFRRGIIAAVRLEDYESSIIFPHENVRNEWVDERVKLMEVGKSNYSPLLVLFRDDLRNTIGAILRAVSGGDPDVVYEVPDLPDVKLWKILDKGTINIITSLMKDSEIFIADGHHRYEAALRYQAGIRSGRETSATESLNYRMMMLVSIDQPGLMTLGYHRHFTNLSPEKSIKIISIIEQKCDIESFEFSEIIDIENKILKLGKRFGDEVSFIVYAPLQKKFFIARNKQKINGNDLFKSEHSWLRREISSIVFEENHDKDYVNPVHDLKTLIDLVNNNKNSIGIIMRPIKMDEFVSIVTRGWRLPPKATNFYPKTSAGIVIQDLTGDL